MLSNIRSTVHLKRLNQTVQILNIILTFGLSAQSPSHKIVDGKLMNLKYLDSEQVQTDAACFILH